KTEPVLHLEHIQPVRNLLITLQEKLATPAGQQVAQTLQQTGDTRELLDILTDDGWLKNEYRKRKLTAVCSHQTRIGNLDAHLI
ncbi:hypothetical protein ACI19U_004934, partial [Escherichia coli]